MYPHPVKPVSKRDACLTNFEDDRESMYSSYMTIIGMIGVTLEFTHTVTLKKKKSRQVSSMLIHLVVTFWIRRNFLLQGCKLENLSIKDLKDLDFNANDLKGYVEVENSIKKFFSYGLTGLISVDNQLNYWVDKH